MELLAPAGTQENFIAAIDAGADAIFLGGKRFNARARAGNFDDAELAESIRLAHLFGAGVHVTLNILLSDEELPEVERYIKRLRDLGADAVIVQDMAVADLVRRVAPELELHASTQMTVSNAETVKYLAAFGFDRVVLARELSLSEIEAICKASPIDIEVFIHGAVCISYSGQCLMSGFLGGRSGNRGECAQPCRLPYELVDRNGVSQLPPDSVNIMSPKDLNYAEHVPALKAAGVASFKVEGRMKNVRYVERVIGAYRRIIDRNRITDAERADIAEGFNRGFTDAYLVGSPGKDMMTLTPPKPPGKAIPPGTVPPDRGYFKSMKRKIAVQAYLEGAERETARLTLLAGDVSVTVTDAYAPAIAMKTPTSVEKVTAQLDRLGKTPFRLESVSIPEGPYMWPASVLNELRRKATDALEEAILRRYDETRRESLRLARERRDEALRTSSSGVRTFGTAVRVAPVDPHADGDRTERRTKRSYPCIAVSVDTIGGAEAAVAAGADAVILAGDRLTRLPYEADAYGQAVNLCRRHGVHCVFSTPRVLKESESAAFANELVRMTAAEPDAIAVHFTGALRMLAAAGWQGEIEGDTGLQIFNRETAKLYERFGVSAVAMSQEATLKQIGVVAKAVSIPVACEVQGLTEMMISEYCAVAAYKGHGTKRDCPMPCLVDDYALRDRKGEIFPLRTDPHCRMHVMNSRELDMAPYVPELVRKGISILRIDARGRDASYVREKVSLYKRILSGAIASPPKYEGSGTVVTRGHYFKGICG